MQTGTLQDMHSKTVRGCPLLVPSGDVVTSQYWQRRRLVILPFLFDDLTS